MSITIEMSARTISNSFFQEMRKMVRTFSKKVMAGSILGFALLTGAVSAAPLAQSYVTIGTGTIIPLEGSHINGNTSATLSGALNSNGVGNMLVEAKHVVPLYPDPTLSSFVANSTNTTSQSVSLTPISDLFYVQVQRSNPLVGTSGWGSLGY